MDKKIPCWATCMGKLALPIKWPIVEKKSYKKALTNLLEEDYTAMDIITNIS